MRFMRFFGGEIIKKKLVLYDSDEVYVMRLAAYLRDNLKGFDILCYTNIECFMDFVEKNTPDVVLAAVNSCEAELLDGQDCLIVLSDESQEPGTGGNTIYKYQSVKLILEEIKKIAGLKQCKKKNSGKTVLYVGMYRPYGSSGIETSLEAARCLAFYGRCLLINFEEFSDINRYVGAPVSGDLSDVIYHFRQGGFTESVLDMAAAHLGNLDVLIPMANPVDLYSESAAELKGILSCIEAMERYDYILLDMGPVAGTRIELLAECQIIIAVADDDMEGKVQSLSEFLKSAFAADTEVSVFGTLELMLEGNENRLGGLISACGKGNRYEE